MAARVLGAGAGKGRNGPWQHRNRETLRPAPARSGRCGCAAVTPPSAARTTCDALEGSLRSACGALKGVARVDRAAQLALRVRDCSCIILACAAIGKETTITGRGRSAEQHRGGMRELAALSEAVREEEWRRGAGVALLIAGRATPRFGGVEQFAPALGCRPSCSRGQRRGRHCECPSALKPRRRRQSCILSAALLLEGGGADKLVLPGSTCRRRCCSCCWRCCWRRCCSWLLRHPSSLRPAAGGWPALISASLSCAELC
jgi:hypothetical protein